jgi:glutathione peroxidase
MDSRRIVSKTFAIVCFLAVSAAAAYSSAVQKTPRKASEKTAQKPVEKTVYDCSLVGFDGKEVPLSTFKGKVLLIVNVASQSIFKDQIPQLEELQKAYKNQGLVVIGVPSNDFGAQEPGTDAEVQKIYSNDFHLSFPVFARASVRGKDQAALYGFLTGDKKGPTGGEVHWSFTKFVVDRGGKVLARFEPHVAPNSPELQATLEDVLAGKFKPPAQKGEGEDGKKGTRDRREGPGR